MINKRAIRYHIVFISLLCLVGLIVVLNINCGSVKLSVREIVRIIFLRDDNDSTAYGVIWAIRLPRIVSALILGGALSASGFLLQTFFRNPIAGPFVLGISSGAKMAVGFVMLVVVQKVGYVSSFVLVISSFAGAMLSMSIVLACSKKTQNNSMLLVIGIMIGYICSAITDFFVTFAHENDIANLTLWSMGSFSGASWEMVTVEALVVFPSCAIVFLLSKPLGAFQLGENYALSMGVNVKLFKILLILFSSLLAACVTAFAGPISFVGIAVPHIAKRMLNTAKPILLIPATFLSGSIFCMFCDLIARTMFSPTELAIGTVTAFFGAPIVISIMLHSKRRSS